MRIFDAGHIRIRILSTAADLKSFSFQPLQVFVSLFSAAF